MLLLETQPKTIMSLHLSQICTKACFCIESSLKQYCTKHINYKFKMHSILTVHTLSCNIAVGTAHTVM